jgi:hypothetical protein
VSASPEAAGPYFLSSNPTPARARAIKLFLYVVYLIGLAQIRRQALLCAISNELARAAIECRPPRQRSRVTNGSALFVQGSGTSAWSRRYRDLCHSHAADLGGTSELSEAQLSLVRRASAIECELEQLEGKLSRGEQIDLDGYGRATNTLRRTLEALGPLSRPLHENPKTSPLMRKGNF